MRARGRGRGFRRWSLSLRPGLSLDPRWNLGVDVGEIVLILVASVVVDIVGARGVCCSRRVIALWWSCVLRRDSGIGRRRGRCPGTNFGEEVGAADFVSLKR